jgi:hypothetical protein
VQYLREGAEFELRNDTAYYKAGYGPAPTWLKVSDSYPSPGYTLPFSGSSEQSDYSYKIGLSAIDAAIKNSLRRWQHKHYDASGNAKNLGSNPCMQTMSIQIPTFKFHHGNAI